MPMSFNQLSIIIPHYNDVDRLKILLNSIPKWIQIIVIDDKSTVSLNSLKATYPHVLFLENETDKKGAGTCRNIGLEHATGQWILFADADDYFTPEFKDAVKNYLSSTVDVVYFIPNSLDLATGEQSHRHIHYEKTLQNYLENPTYENKLKVRYELVAPWSKMIKRALLENYQIRFDEVLVSNDYMFSTKVGYYLKDFVISKTVIYVSTENQGSLTKQISKENFLTRIQIYMNVFDFLQKNLSKKDFQTLDMASLGFLILGYRYKISFSLLIKTGLRMKKVGIPLFKRTYKNPKKVLRLVKFYKNKHREEKKFFVKEAVELKHYPNISVIVPAYNCENTIIRALESIKNQTYPGKIELIVVNDGSTDRTEEILNAYKITTENRNLSVFHHINQGVSVARNKGIELATGDYLLFLDSDDYYYQSAIEKYMEKLAETSNDILIGNIEQKIEELFLIGEDKQNQLYNLFLTGVINSPCGKVYRRDFIRRAGIQFNPELSIGEDLIFNLQAYFSAKSIIIYPYIGYVYDHSASQLTTTYPQAYFSQRLQLLQQVGQLFNDNQIEFLDESWFYCKLCLSVYLKYLTNKEANFKEKINFVNEVRNHSEVHSKLTKNHKLLKVRIFSKILTKFPAILLVLGLNLLPIIKKLAPRGSAGVSV